MILQDTVLDNLTGLPYSDYFKKETPAIIRDKMKAPVMLSLDISNFKYFNQMYGFETGDKLIKRCIDTYCKNEECIMAFRIYVDHIIILIDAGDMDTNSVKMKYDAINKDFSDAVNEDFPLARIRAYMGMYVIEDKNEDIGIIIDKAQCARRSIKVNYSQTIAVYSDDMQVKTQEEASVIPMFFSALLHDRIKVYIQPKFSIGSQELIGGEALSRILDFEGKVVSPKVYIEILEKSGLICKLDDYVIMKVINIQKQWMKEGRKLTVISVNLSRMDFWEEGFIEKIDKAIVESGVPTKYFEFELTETIFCENMSVVTKQIDYLRERGYRISMDDFGSGYNSLYMLGTVPVDIIKFDRGFILNSLNVETGRKIMKNLVTTFKDIEFDVICEGIENREEEQIVHECGCDAVQGYLHDMPIPYEDFANKYLKEKNDEV